MRRTVSIACRALFQPKPTSIIRSKSSPPSLARRLDQRHVELGRAAERPPAQLDRVEAGLALRRHRARRRLGRLGHQRAGIGLDPIALLAADQGVDRLAQRLADHVPERDLDAAHRVQHHAAPAVIDRALVHLAPQAADLEGLLADDQRRQARGDLVRGGRFDHRLGDVRRGIDLAYADDAGIGVDADDQRVLAAVGDVGIDRAGRPQQDGLNLGDQHLSPALRRWV
ncbi:MAG: hypothetical protein U1E52_05500 [Geminicoccaceae bacterium]